ncbi:MAG: RNA methyltransferase [Paludibacteraceae bacterium]|nr:RNA methyltransferase [Paludibacteraceae bacterium]
MKKRTIEEMNRLSVEDFKKSVKTPLIAVLDQVRSAHNAGSVLRTADAFRLEAVYLCGITPTPPDADLHKTALGAEDSVRWKHYADTLQAVEELHAAGYCVLAVEQCERSTPLQAFAVEPGKPYALVLGHEVTGVQQAVVDACDGCLEIPQAGTKHSLNVSVAGGIVLWELFKQLNPQAL